MRLFPVDPAGLIVLTLAVGGLISGPLCLVFIERPWIQAAVCIPVVLLILIFIGALTVEVFGGHGFECVNFCPSEPVSR